MMTDPIVHEPTHKNGTTSAPAATPASVPPAVDVVFVQLFALGVIASVLVGFSAWKFRGQMS